MSLIIQIGVTVRKLKMPLKKIIIIYKKNLIFKPWKLKINKERKKIKLALKISYN
jgi:hypothetical protein